MGQYTQKKVVIEKTEMVLTCPQVIPVLLNHDTYARIGEAVVKKTDAGFVADITIDVPSPPIKMFPSIGYQLIRWQPKGRDGEIEIIEGRILHLSLGFNPNTDPDIKPVTFNQISIPTHGRH